QVSEVSTPRAASVSPMLESALPGGTPPRTGSPSGAVPHAPSDNDATSVSANLRALIDAPVAVRATVPATRPLRAHRCRPCDCRATLHVDEADRLPLTC